MIKKKLGELTGTVKEVTVSGLLGPVSPACRERSWTQWAELVPGQA